MFIRSWFPMITSGYLIAIIQMRRRAANHVNTTEPLEPLPVNPDPTPGLEGAATAATAAQTL